MKVSDIESTFQDLAPVPQDDGDVPVCAINYPVDFRVAYDYFRAVLRKDERSDRALDLTEICLELNPANYTAWHFRRLCLYEKAKLGDGGGGDEPSPPATIAAAADLFERDLALASRLGGHNPKNYQIWYHRRALLEELGRQQESPPRRLEEFCRNELEYLRQVAVVDAKNYHMWSHRQWVAQILSGIGVDKGERPIWEEELEYSREMIGLDVRNNSAWNHRWFACHRGKQHPLSLTGNGESFAGTATGNGEGRRELEYALAQARIDPYNESPWRYFVAVLKEVVKTLRKQGNEKSGVGDADSVLEEYEQQMWDVQQVLEGIRENSGKEAPGVSPNLLSAAIDVLEMKAAAPESAPAALRKVVDLATSLATEHDPIRRKYWLLRRDRAVAKLERANNTW